jgi:DNA-binding transcriptional regulator LsrR (DeoR family)
MAKVIPRVRIHALTSAFDVTNWEKAPSAFVNYFSQTGLLVDFIGLYCPAVVASSEYQHVKQEVGVKKAFALAEEIDIVVTSLGTDDPNNSELVHCLEEFDKQNKTDVLKKLTKLEFRGDVLYQPFSDTRPIKDLAAVPVTLFDIEKLCEWSERSDKHVVLVAGSTADGKSKAKALVPLLSQRSLRIWDHLVLDTRTAQGVCSEFSGE